MLALVFALFTCTWLPLEAQSVIQNVTIPIQCVAQNYAQMVTTRCVSDLKDTSDRNANMFAKNTVTTDTVLHLATLCVVMSQCFNGDSEG